MARLGRYRRVEALVGLFSLSGILVLVFGLLWLRDFRFTRRYNVYSAKFPSTGGLLVGDPVMVFGMQKGKVRSMELRDDGVDVDLAVEQDVRLRSDAKALIVTRGILGELYVEIDRGKAEATLPPGSRLPADVQIGMAELMASTGELVESARAVSDDVRKILKALSGAVDDQNLQGGLQDAAASARQLRQLLEANRDAFATSVQNFSIASQSMARISTGAEQDVLETTKRLHSTVGALDSLMAQLQGVATKTDRVADRLLDEESTFGKLVTDRELYDQLVLITTHADSLIAEIKEHPNRYFKFSLF